MIPLPATVRRRMERDLPGSPHVVVIPLDAQYRRCAAYSAEWYEIVAFHVDMGYTLLELDVALCRMPGMEIVTTITPPGVHNPAWPITYRDTASLRPQVRALIRPAALAWHGR